MAAGACPRRAAAAVGARGGARGDGGRNARVRGVGRQPGDATAIAASARERVVLRVGVRGECERADSATGDRTAGRARVAVAARTAAAVGASAGGAGFRHGQRVSRRDAGGEVSGGGGSCGGYFAGRARGGAGECGAPWRGWAREFSSRRWFCGAAGGRAVRFVGGESAVHSEWRDRDVAARGARSRSAAGARWGRGWTGFLSSDRARGGGVAAAGRAGDAGVW